MLWLMLGVGATAVAPHGRAQNAVSTSLEPLNRLHLLIPGSAGGGWDTTARAVGNALRSAGLIEQVSFENLSGAGGARGVAQMVESAAASRHVLMVSSTPIVVRSLIPVYQQSWRQLSPIAAVIGDYGMLAVRADSPFTTLTDLLDTLRRAPRSIKFAGGSNRGGLDHLIAAQFFQAAGLDPTNARYVAYDAGGRALLSLLSGETPVMSATVGDAMGQIQAGGVRVLAVAAPERLRELPEVPTFVELGYPLVFLNWRGFFAAPGVSAARRRQFIDLLLRLERTPQWETARARHGWVNNFIGGAEFERYLEEQERTTAALMQRLGFLP